MSFYSIPTAVNQRTITDGQPGCLTPTDDGDHQHSRTRSKVRYLGDAHVAQLIACSVPGLNAQQRATLLLNKKPGAGMRIVAELPGTAANSGVEHEDDRRMGR